MHVRELWRYPVKSLRGERTNHAKVDERGIEGDRAFALVDADGKLGSHKSSRRFVRMKGLFELAGHRVGEATRVTLADGMALDVNDPSLNAALSRHVGQPVTVEAEAGVSHQDAGALHILTTASLRWLRARTKSVDVRRFRPNIVIDVDGVGLPERDWVGRTLSFANVALRVTQPTERCVMTTLAQAELTKDPSVLRALAKEASACFGVYASVTRPGDLQVGEAIRLEA